MIPDQKIWDAFADGYTDIIFQFESSGMKQTLKGMKPTSINDLSVANALYRPGSMKFIDNYVARKNGEEEYKFLHPDLEEILGDTFAIIVFQEQLIEIGRLAKLRNPDLLRQGTAKKRPEVLAVVEPELRQGLYDRGWTKEQVDELWRIMLDFAKYSFNRSHSAAYAIIALYCMFLKLNHPNEFMAAALNSLIGKEKEKVEVAYKEAKRLGVQFLKPDFRKATAECVVEDGKIRYGLNLIKYCNEQIAHELAELGKNQYSHFVDLLVDIEEKTSLNSKQLDILINLGYFEEFGEIEKLLKLRNTFTDGKIKYSKTHKPVTKEKRITALREYEDTFNEQLPLRGAYEIIAFEKEYYGFIKSVFPDYGKRDVAILEVDLKYTPKITSYVLHNGETFTFKIKKKDFYDSQDQEVVKVGDIIKIKKLGERERMKKVDDEWVGTGENDYYLEQCILLHTS